MLGTEPKPVILHLKVCKHEVPLVMSPVMQATRLRIVENSMLLVIGYRSHSSAIKDVDHEELWSFLVSSRSGRDHGAVHQDNITDSLVRRAHIRFLPIFRIVPRGFRWVSPVRCSPGTKNPS